MIQNGLLVDSDGIFMRLTQNSDHSPERLLWIHPNFYSQSTLRYLDSFINWLLRHILVRPHGQGPFLGSGPDRVQSPVEWGEILFVHPSVRPSVHPSVPPLAGLRPCWLAPRPLPLALRPCRLALRPLQLALITLQLALRPRLVSSHHSNWSSYPSN